MLAQNESHLDARNDITGNDMVSVLVEGWQAGQK